MRPYLARKIRQGGNTDRERNKQQLDREQHSRRRRRQKTTASTLPHTTHDTRCTTGGDRPFNLISTSSPRQPRNYDSLRPWLTENNKRDTREENKTNQTKKKKKKNNGGTDNALIPRTPSALHLCRNPPISSESPIDRSSSVAITACQSPITSSGSSSSIGPCPYAAAKSACRNWRLIGKPYARISTRHIELGPNIAPSPNLSHSPDSESTLPLGKEERNILTVQ